MISLKTRTFSHLLAVIFFASLALPSLASAQCGSAVQEFQNISLVAGNPFQAEYATTVTSTLLTLNPTTSHSGLKSVARDSAGRVRVVRAAGKYIVKTADGGESEVERQSIWICDPATATFTVLDTANKTATITAPRGNLPRMVKPKPGQGESFCTRVFSQRERRPNSQTQDLGHQLISGYDTVGIRMQLRPLIAAGAESMGSSYAELWCSDELGVMLQQGSGSESKSGKAFKNQSTMQNIERTEPDPALFQIPSDYTILERAPGSTRPGLLRPAPAPAAPENPR